MSRASLDSFSLGYLLHEAVSGQVAYRPSPAKTGITGWIIMVCVFLSFMNKNGEDRGKNRRRLTPRSSGGGVVTLFADPEKTSSFANVLTELFKPHGPRSTGTRQTACSWSKPSLILACSLHEQGANSHSHGSRRRLGALLSSHAPQ